MNRNAPHIIAVAGLVCVTACVIWGPPEARFASLAIAVLTFLFYAHAVGCIKRHDDQTNNRNAD